MTGQLQNIGRLLEKRLQVTQEIAAENVEHLRLSQIASGLMVLDMKDDEDGQSASARDDERKSNFEALERCMGRINNLEAVLKKLDLELQAATKEEKSK